MDPVSVFGKKAMRTPLDWRGWGAALDEEPLLSSSWFPLPRAGKVSPKATERGRPRQDESLERAPIGGLGPHSETALAPRVRRLLETQTGEATMLPCGNVEIPQEAFIAGPTIGDG